MRFTLAWMVAMGKALASGQSVDWAKLLYSTLRMGLPSWTKGWSDEHSLYCQHCSSISPSTLGASVVIRLSLLISFFRKKAKPSA